MDNFSPRRDHRRKLRTQRFVYASVARSQAIRGFRLFRRYFFSGLLIILPSAVTLYILLSIFRYADSGPLGKMMTRMIGFNVPGLGLVLTIAFILLAGIVTTNVVGRRFVKLIEDTLGRIPVASHVLTAIRQMSELVISGRKVMLERPVLIEYPRRGVYTMGFVTADAPECMCAVAGKKLVSIFVPTTPNPTSGFILTLPEEDAVDIGFSVDDAMKWIISAGMIVPPASGALKYDKTEK